MQCPKCHKEVKKLKGAYYCKACKFQFEKPPFFDWVMFDEQPFWIVTRIGFIFSFIVMLSITAFITFKAAQQNILLIYRILTVVAIAVTVIWGRKLLFFYKNIILLNKTAMIDSCPDSVCRTFGVPDKEAAKNEYKKLYRGEFND